MNILSQAFRLLAYLSIGRVDAWQIDFGHKLYNGRFSRVSLSADNLQAIDSIFMYALIPAIMLNIVTQYLTEAVAYAYMTRSENGSMPIVH
jgi:hypothetical protein